jgi:putative transposase
MSCCSSSACGCRHARCATICPSPWTADEADPQGPTLAYLCAQPCPGDCRLRLLRGGHGDLSSPLCLCVIEHASRRLLHINVTAPPTAAWTLQQLREAIPVDHGYRFLIHDHDSIFSPALGRSIRNLGLRALKTPPRVPRANAICERVIGTLRCECLDFVIPLTENHLRRLLHEWVRHYNEGRPHMSLGPGIPRPPASLPASLHEHRHRFPEYLRVVACPALSGLHHEYRLEAKAV